MLTSQLINNPFADPGLYVKFKHRNEAILFDLGDIHLLPPKNILKVHTIFVSHTHMDHFIGFDYILRICLGRNMHIKLFGPPGFLKNVEGKLSAYTWNLVENYSNDFVLEITEIHPSHTIANRYSCRSAFNAESQTVTEGFNGIIYDRNIFMVKGIFLDHKIPSLAFSLQEKSRINIKKNVLMERGLPTGKWLSFLKECIIAKKPDNTIIPVRGKMPDNSLYENEILLGDLKKGLITITEGQKISYIADALYNDENKEKIIELAKDSDIMFIEASFAQQDTAIAREKYHLTASQAGTLARMAGAKRVIPFHFSPKYKSQGDLLTEEVMKAFFG